MPAAQHAEDDEDATSASQLAVQLRGDSHDDLSCLLCLGSVAWRSGQTAHDIPVIACLQLELFLILSTTPRRVLGICRR